MKMKTNSNRASTRALPKARRVLTVSLVVAGSIFWGAGRADAIPSNCQSRYLPDAWEVGEYVCYAGTGFYAVSVRCDKPWAPDYTRYGAWREVGSGLPSWAACDDGHRAYDLTRYLADHL